MCQKVKKITVLGVYACDFCGFPIILVYWSYGENTVRILSFDGD